MTRDRIGVLTGRAAVTVTTYGTLWAARRW